MYITYIYIYNDQYYLYKKETILEVADDFWKVGEVNEVNRLSASPTSQSSSSSCFTFLSMTIHGGSRKNMTCFWSSQKRGWNQESEIMNQQPHTLVIPSGGRPICSHRLLVQHQLLLVRSLPHQTLCHLAAVAEISMENAAVLTMFYPALHSTRRTCSLRNWDVLHWSSFGFVRGWWFCTQCKAMLMKWQWKNMKKTIGFWGSHIQQTQQFGWFLGRILGCKVQPQHRGARGVGRLGSKRPHATASWWFHKS